MPKYAILYTETVRIPEQGHGYEAYDRTIPTYTEYLNVEDLKKAIADMGTPLSAYMNKPKKYRVIEFNELAVSIETVVDVKLDK